MSLTKTLIEKGIIKLEMCPKCGRWKIPKLGACTILQGDARRLTELLAEHVGAVITSPPFGDTNLSAGDPERRRERLLQAGHDPGDFLGGSARNAVLKHYGQADAIIVSPPYGDAVSDDKE